jgi:hypothetical protein
MDRRELITGFGAVLALQGAAALAGGAIRDTETAEGEGFYFRRGKGVHTFRRLKIELRGESAATLRLGEGDKAEVIRARMSRSGRSSSLTLDLDPGPGVRALEAEGRLERDRSGAPAMLRIESREDPDFLIVFISDGTLGDAEVEDAGSARGTLKRPRAGDLELNHARVLLADAGTALITVRTSEGEAARYYFSGSWRRVRSGNYELTIRNYFRSTGDLRTVSREGRGTLEVNSRGRVLNLDLTAPTDRGDFKLNVKRDRN